MPPRADGEQRDHSRPFSKTRKFGGAKQVAAWADFGPLKLLRQSRDPGGVAGCKWGKDWQIFMMNVCRIQTMSRANPRQGPARGYCWNQLARRIPPSPLFTFTAQPRGPGQRHHHTRTMKTLEGNPRSHGAPSVPLLLRRRLGQHEIRSVPILMTSTSAPNLTCARCAVRVWAIQSTITADVPWQHLPCTN